MYKPWIDYCFKTATLAALTLFLPVVYIKGGDSSFLLLTGAVACGVMLVLYNIIFFRRRRILNAPVQRKEEGRIRPRNLDAGGNKNLRSVQVSPAILEKIKIGRNYYYGIGLPKDFRLAFNYLFDGAFAGDAEAQMLVGKMFLYGQGVGRNMSNAITWLEVASFQGSIEAQYQLGKIYAEAADNKIAQIKAYYFLGKASQGGSAEAGSRLKDLIKRHPLSTSIRDISDESFFDIEHNPFIRAICIDQLTHEPVPSYTVEDVKKCFRFFELEPTGDLDRVHHRYMSYMIKYHPDRNGKKRDYTKKILMVRRAYDILEHFITSRQKKSS